ncbi:hypothetical protein [Nitrobacter sp.]|uniref:hypothetical protein n=1 Tax=Nitrobacter sp. TaxID=29420 RepID=UPI00399D7624
MADEAFALSPMSASAAPLGAADFDAIREAFMETSRGRWFLTEYARRNRNADTAMVLDAVARIEQTVAAQQQAATSDALPKALAAIKVSVAEAKAAAAASFDKRIMDDTLAPIERGARIIREISWRWREIGGDSRICDILDSQAGVIDAVYEQLAARDDSAALQVVFGLIESTLDELSDPPAATTPPPRAETVTPSPATADEASASREDAAPPERAAADAGIVFSNEVESGSREDNASDQESQVFHHFGETVEESSVGSENAASASEAQAAAVDTAKTEFPSEQLSAAAVNEQDTAHDDAVLDLIALEMGAPDFDEPETVDAAIGDPVIAEPARTAERAADNSDTSPREESGTIPEIAAPPSLGASLLESGIVPRATPRSDPLAPIRRMTQAEKIAFFS